MNDFLFLLSFSAIPLLTALSYAALTPVLGATLHLRGEIMLGIVLPPFGSAVIGLCAFCGISIENRLLLYSIVAVSLFSLLSAPVFSFARTVALSRRKEMVLAAVFVLGQTVTYLCMHLSTNVRIDLSHLLNGEILAVGPVEFGTALAMNTVLIYLYCRYRGVLFAFCLDETGLRIQERGVRWIETTYRISASIVITSSIVHLGPLLTTAWLVLPALFAEWAAPNIESFFMIGIAISVCATLTGFIAALMIDLPPVHVISTSLFFLGAGIVLVSRILIKRF
jgi:ABC-type Mn2+/Zn2+ transport system permease subunit